MRNGQSDPDYFGSKRYAFVAKPRKLVSELDLHPITRLQPLAQQPLLASNGTPAHSPLAGNTTAVGNHTHQLTLPLPHSCNTKFKCITIKYMVILQNPDLSQANPHSPISLNCGSASPLSMASFTYVGPSMSSPSAGILPPGKTCSKQESSDTDITEAHHNN